MYTNKKYSVSGALSPGYTSFKKEIITMADKILRKIYVYKRRYIRWRAGIEKKRYQAIRVAKSGFDI